MVLAGNELLDVLKRTEGPIKLKNEANRTVRMVSASEALQFGRDLFVGIGNRDRIRCLRPLTMVVALNRGSVNTRRIRNAGGQYIAHPQIREHIPVRPPLARPAIRNGSK